jgi:hypothetical protein
MSDQMPVLCPGCGDLAKSLFECPHCGIVGCNNPQRDAYGKYICAFTPGIIPRCVLCGVPGQPLSQNRQ